MNDSDNENHPKRKETFPGGVHVTSHKRKNESPASHRSKPGKSRIKTQPVIDQSQVHHGSKPGKSPKISLHPQKRSARLISGCSPRPLLPPR